MYKFQYIKDYTNRQENQVTYINIYQKEISGIHISYIIF